MVGIPPTILYIYIYPSRVYASFNMSWPKIHQDRSPEVGADQRELQIRQVADGTWYPERWRSPWIAMDSLW